MSLIMGPFGLEQLELFALELGKIAAFDFGHICRDLTIGTKLGHNVYEHKISGLFDY